MSTYKYKFSIFTPCYNSEKFIHRVFETLNSQTYRNFEWIVINDASTDNTAHLIREYIKSVSFKVKFFDLEKNQMLAANYNLALSVAEGEIFFPYGHDDVFISTVLEEYIQLLEKYDDKDIAGITARCQTQYGDISSPVYEKPVMNYWEYGHVNGKYVGEMPDCIKTDIMKKYIGATDLSKTKLLIDPKLLSACDGYKMICYNKVVRTYYVFENDTSLSKINNKFSKSVWYKLIFEINLYQYYYKDKSMLTTLKIIWLYIYKEIKSGVSFTKGLKELTHCKDRLLYICSYLPIVVLSVLKMDIIAKKIFR